MGRRPRGRSRLNLYAEAVRIFGTDDLFPWGNDAMNDEKAPSTVKEWRAEWEAAQSATDPDVPDTLFDDAARERNREYNEIASEAGASDETLRDLVLHDVYHGNLSLIRAAVAVRVVARILVDAHAAATARGASLRAAQARAGHAIDTRADYAEGSAAAYSFALSALEGATGATRATLVGEGWAPPSGMAPPVLPDGVTVIGTGQVETVALDVTIDENETVTIDENETVTIDVTVDETTAEPVAACSHLHYHDGHCAEITCSNYFSRCPRHSFAGRETAICSLIVAP